MAIPLLLGCSATAESETGELRDALLDGVLDPQRHAVFALRRTLTMDSGSKHEVVCSSVLVAPDLLLTARHCVTDVRSSIVVCGHTKLGQARPASDFSVSNDPVLTENATWRTVTRVVVPARGDDACGFDMALLVLSAAVPPEAAVPLRRSETPVSPGELLTAVGYGLTDEPSAPRARMQREVQVTCLGTDDCGINVAASEFRSSAGPCEGDSGGPAIDARGAVVGVLSRGTDACSNPVYSSVPHWTSFIQDGPTTASGAAPSQSAIENTPGCALAPPTSAGPWMPTLLWALVLLAYRGHSRVSRDLPE